MCRYPSRLLRQLLCLAAFGLQCISLSAQSVSLSSYYSKANGKKQAELKTALYQIIGSPKVMGYSALWTYYYDTDRLSDNQVVDRYSNTKRYFSGSIGSTVSGMNKEHSIPKSWWGGGGDAYSDLHHVLPSDSEANSQKSNYGMGVVTNETWTNGSIKVGKGQAGNNGTVSLWEPADEWKGDFARLYFYIVTCYEELNMVQKEGANTMNDDTYPKLQSWASELYLKWSREDPVSETEIRRNEAVYRIQGNRNPFIDYPSLAEYIWGDSINYAFDVSTGHSIDPIDPDTTVVVPDTLSQMTIAQINQVGPSNEAQTQATVQAVYSSGLMLGDGTGYMTVYLGATPSVEVGDVVLVKGSTTVYGGCLQFGQGTSVTKVSTASVSYPAAVELDGTTFDALVETPVVTYVKVKGTLTVSGKYKNLEIDGATHVGSIQCTSDLLGSISSGQEIVVTGFFAYTSGSSTKYGNIIATKIEAEGTPVDALDIASIAEAKSAATTEQVPVVFKAIDLLVTYVYGNSVYVSDGTDGLLLYGANDGIKAGDKISADVRGQLYLYNGLTEITVSEYADLVVNSSDNIVETQYVTIADVLNDFDKYESELVTFSALTPGADALENRNIVFIDDSDNEITIRDNFKMLTNATFDTSKSYTVTGFVSIYENAAGTTIQIYPRGVDDISDGSEPAVYEFAGDGSLTNPYTVEDIQHIETTDTKTIIKEDVWVKGYIVGYISSTSLNENSAMFTVEAPEGTDSNGNPLTVSVSNILLADESDACSVDAVIPVALPNKSLARTDLNLADNAEKFHAQVWLNGNVIKYMGVSGLKDIKAYSLDGSAVVDAILDTEMAVTESDAFTLSGQRVRTVNRSGLYIVNGRKVLVR